MYVDVRYLFLDLQEKHLDQTVLIIRRRRGEICVGTFLFDISSCVRDFMRTWKTDADSVSMRGLSSHSHMFKIKN